MVQKDLCQKNGTAIVLLLARLYLGRRSIHLRADISNRKLIALCDLNSNKDRRKPASRWCRLEEDTCKFHGLLCLKAATYNLITM